jgi:hypothetical protein
MRQTGDGEFFPERFSRRLELAKDVPAIFELVRDAVKEQVGVVRSGLDLGLVDLEDVDGKIPVALHPLNCNCIVVNRKAVEVVKRQAPEILRSLLFHSLLYEYLQTVGFVPEPEIKGKVLEISLALFGKEHPVTKMAEDLSLVMPMLTYPRRMPLPEGSKVSSLKELDEELV